jgi:hypothetical protein
MNTSRSFISLILALVMGFALTGCQTLPPSSLAKAVDRANTKMRLSGHPPSHYDVPAAVYKYDEGGWLVKYVTRQGFVRRYVNVFVPDVGEPQFVQATNHYVHY